MSNGFYIRIAKINYKLPFWDINLPFLDRVDILKKSTIYIFQSNCNCNCCPENITS